MHVRLHPAHHHSVRDRVEASEVQRPRAAKDHDCRRSDRDCRPAVKLENLAQALAQSVLAKVKQSFSITLSAAPRPAGLNPSEQARGDLANAVGTALNTPSGEGSLPAAADVRAVAESAIHASAEELRQIGASASALTDAVDALTGHLSSLFGALGTPQGAADDSFAAAATSARLVTKEKGVLEVRTLEGDVVRIRFGSRVDVRTQGFVAADGAGAASSIDVTANLRSTSELSVKGDLNDAELAAIADLVVKVDALANEFFAGNIDKAFAAAAALDLEGGPLADLALKLSMSQRYSESNVVARQPLPATASQSVEPDAASTAAEAPHQVDTAPAASSESSAAATPSMAPPETSTDPSAPADSIQLVIAKFMARARVNLQDDGTARLGVSMKVKFELLVAAIEAATPADAPAERAGVAKLADVANLVAAQDAG